MKVWEAQNILEGMDPNAEVTLTIGKQHKKPQEPWPYRPHVGTPMYRYYPNFVPYEEVINPNTVTCH